MDATINPFAGRVIDAAAVVNYNDDAVVSKTLIDKPVGTITIFAFDAGQGLSEHTAPYDAFIQILDGEAEITIAATSHQCKAGQLIIMPARIPHSVKAKTKFKMMLVMIRA